MREDFLHFLWRQARFDLRDLRTTTGETLSIQNFGQHNSDGGPDFSGGQLRIDGLQWAGNIEMHVKASEWYTHGHESDPAYDNVILHVVLEEDRPVFRRNGQRIPCLELRERIPAGLLASYWRLTHNQNWIPCQQQLHLVAEPTRQQWLEQVLGERITARSHRFERAVEQNHRGWEEVFYHFLARALGGRVNCDAMEMLARSVPLRVLLKHKHSLLQLEALLFGQSGLLPTPEEGEDAYVTLVRREYDLLRVKYALQPMPAAAWRYLRLRPNNFPTVRIAQLAAMLHRTGQLFGKSLAAADAKELENMFEVGLSNYWRTHFRFGKEGHPGSRRLGTDTVQSILINTIAPALVAYGRSRLDERYAERAYALLAELPAEANNVIRRWEQMGFVPQSAADSQALLQLKTDYCEKSRCMECAIGCQLLQHQYRNDQDAPLLTLNEEAQLYELVY
ncbi:DUF2851 family protein [Neolewinella lacunae]|uniref:DUF2851 family protein n=1 Tax=Neolewinella lacunae TaxID=1517758 RepID=A0A923TE78_9BACT|nr:DUF2851 family protein [Neolewinella lacunae]MBC6995622.1 DUF2851 family protein [Neolewinella lacunae]MDN3635658.1 DUF2851 family protein [Neolewinella lacunae]